MENRLRLKYSQIYLILVAIVALQDAFNSSMLLSPVYTVLKPAFLVFILSLSALQAVKQGYSIKRLLAFGVCILLAINTARVLETNSVLYIVLLSFFSINKDMRASASIIFKIVGSVFLLHVIIFTPLFLVHSGSLPTLVQSGVTRFYVFYDHPNNAAKTFLFLVVLYFYMNFQSINFKKILLIIALAIYMYMLTRSDALVCTAIPVMFYVFRRNKYTVKVAEWLARYGMILFTGISTIVALLSYIPYVGRFITLVDIYANGRFGGFGRTVQMYGITILGQVAKFGSSFMFDGKEYGWIYADNITIYCLTCLGVIYLVLMCLLFLKTAPKMSFEQRIVIIMFAIFGLFENRIFTVEVYFALMMAVSVGYSKVMEGNKWSQ